MTCLTRVFVERIQWQCRWSRCCCCKPPLLYPPPTFLWLVIWRWSREGCLAATATPPPPPSSTLRNHASTPTPVHSHKLFKIIRINRVSCFWMTSTVVRLLCWWLWVADVLFDAIFIIKYLIVDLDHEIDWIFNWVDGLGHSIALLNHWIDCAIHCCWYKSGYFHPPFSAASQLIICPVITVWDGFDQWRTGSTTTDNQFQLQLQLHYPQDRFHTQPSGWEILKWIWIQYYSIFVVILFLSKWILGKLIRGRVLLTQSHIDTLISPASSNNNKHSFWSIDALHACHVLQTSTTPREGGWAVMRDFVGIILTSMSIKSSQNTFVKLSGWRK